MPRIRTITDAINLLKQDVPGTRLSEFLIRKLALQKKIRSIKTGTKLLVDYDSLMAYLSSKEYELPNEQLVID